MVRRRNKKKNEESENRGDRLQKNNNVDSQDKKKNPGHALQGQMYQIKLLMLFLCRGVSHEYTSFRLGTERKEAKKFDDIVFEYTEGDRKKYRLLQAKHKAEESKKITSFNLLREKNGNYNLKKYFSSYQDSKKEDFFKDGLIEDATICTNINFDFDDLNEEPIITIEKIESKDDILDVNIVDGHKQPARYKFKEDISSLIQDYTTLAGRLTECVLKNDPIKHDEKNDVFKDYHLALAEDVIDIENKKFHDKFLKNENISDDAKNFRNSFVKELTKKSKGKLKLKNLNEAIVSKRRIIDDNEAVGLNLSENFGRGNNKNWPIDDEIKDFLNHFVIAANQPNEKELGQIIQKEMSTKFNLDSEYAKNIYNELTLEMVDWLTGEKKNEFISYEEGKKKFESACIKWFDIKSQMTLFTGREQELKDLHEKVQRGSEKTRTISEKLTSICGLGGIGKSELARRYIHEHSKDYDDNIVWVNAESEATLTESFLKLAQDKLRIRTKNEDGSEKRIRSIVEEVYRIYFKKRSLFIFDNADKPDDMKKSFLPNGAIPPNGNMPYILVTSRNKVWEMQDGKVLNLNELNLKDAIELVKKGLRIPEEDVSQDQAIEKLVKFLQCFPLALQQAIGYIIENKRKLWKDNEYTIDTYLQKYEDEKKELLDAKLFQSLDNHYTKTTFTTWKVTIDKITDNMEYGQLALKFLHVIAYFAPNNIPVIIYFVKLEEDNRKLWKAIELLYQYSMIELKRGEIDVHRLVKEVTRLKLKDEEKKSLEEAVKLFLNGSKIEKKETLKRVLNHSKIKEKEDLEEALKLFENGRIFYYHLQHIREELLNEWNSLPHLIVSEVKYENKKYVKAAFLRFTEESLRSSDSVIKYKYVVLK